MEIRGLADAAAVRITAYPSLSKEDRLKRFVKSAVRGHKPEPVDRFSWPNAMLGQGLLAAYAATGETDCLLAVLAYLRQWKSAGFPIRYVDNVMNGSLALWIEELLLRETVWEESGQTIMLNLCREAAQACAAWLKNAGRTGEGIFPYRHRHPDWLFADALGMVCPFLCGYGAKKGEDAFLDTGVRQLTQFLERGMDAKTGLPYHGYDEKSGMKYGIIGWGRACGWMLDGLTESLLYIPQEHEAYEFLRAASEALFGAVFAWQREDGGFSWQLQALEGHRDSSAEGMIGTALLTGCRAGVFDGTAGNAHRKNDMPKTAGKAGASAGTGRAWCDGLCRAICASVEKDAVLDCSGECRGFSEYPQVYGSYPWGTGSVLAFLSGICYTEKYGRTEG